MKKGVTLLCTCKDKGTGQTVNPSCEFHHLQISAIKDAYQKFEIIEKQQDLLFTLYILSFLGFCLIVTLMLYVAWRT
jgi:hypothetical protein